MLPPIDFGNCPWRNVETHGYSELVKGKTSPMSHIMIAWAHTLARKNGSNYAGVLNGKSLFIQYTS